MSLFTNAANQFAAGRVSMRTNTNRQINMQASVGANGSNYIVTLGWVDTRGRFN
jgi:hypothetical protein